jgi:hypothetical protein
MDLEQEDPSMAVGAELVSCPGSANKAFKLLGDSTVEKEVNPQDATLGAPADFAVTVYDDNFSSPKSSTATPNSSSEFTGEDKDEVPEARDAKLAAVQEEEQDEGEIPENSSQSKNNGSNNFVRRRRRRSRIAPILEETCTQKTGLSPPSNQYECVLRRRAIKPIPEDCDLLKKDDAEEKIDDVYGDVSLGMKLSVAENGNVIVQKVIPLADGRASPAQLTGVIQRGDILLAIDGVSLTANALAVLNVLRAPENKMQPCQREYRLRFVAGEGHALLQKIERLSSHSSDRLQAAIMRDPASEMLALFPMVDQLSGMPYFDEQHLPTSQREEMIPQEVSAQTSKLEEPDVILAATKPTALNDLISARLSELRVREKTLFLNNELGALLLGCDHAVNAPDEELLTLKERQELGTKAMIGARNLLKQVENIDAGKDQRSFQSWNTALSLYSRASTRRKHVMDSASLPLNFGRVEEDGDEDENSVGDGEQSSSNSEQLDGDEVLLRLAAHDEIWRKQVIEFLEKAAQEASEECENLEDETTQSDFPANVPADINAAMSNELGNFLFGENMTKILAKNRSPRLLPSEEVTAVLFDLTTKLSASVPDEIMASGSLLSYKSGLTPFTTMKRHPAGSDYVLATRFLIDDALPGWFRTFRPLAWDHRRILWPVERSRVSGSTAASTISDDSLTLDGMSIGTAPSNKPKKCKKDIREIIEDKELNVETRGET